MSRRFFLFVALSLLAAPAVAQTPPAYRYQQVAVKNASPASILVTMRWNTPASVLPQGVRRIYALQNSHRLLVEATPDGYARLKAIVGPLDVAAPKPQK